ncbi:MAG: hypothetical protein ACKER6_01305 [Candidatus Hodgkinia cicadicola]
MQRNVALSVTQWRNPPIASTLAGRRTKGSFVNQNCSFCCVYWFGRRRHFRLNRMLMVSSFRLALAQIMAHGSLRH